MGFLPLQPWHWLILAGVMLIAELMTTTLFFLLLAASAVIVAVIAWLLPTLNWEVQLTFFAILSISSLFIWSSWLKNRPEHSDQPHLNRRGQQYIGRQFTLEEDIVNGIGKIRVDDTIWRVEGPSLGAGSTVVVTGVDGATLTVDRASS